MKTEKLKKHYSGPKSIDFWKRINSIKDPTIKELLYIAGCSLQDAEERMFQMLEVLEEQ